ncbi:MAG: M24 family metallopeptidase [Eubacterium sp.]|nr:M24 family metallopeptidase [Eubacterium sp.]
MFKEIIYKNKEKEQKLYFIAQTIAKKTIEYAKEIIKPGLNLIELRKMCENKMLELGADSFWYYGIGAFIFAGNETVKSVSGKEYIISDYIIKSDDIITIDLSPQIKNIWGDYARTVIIQNGKVVDKINQIQNTEWKSGLLIEEKLHSELFNYATSNTTFEELYYHMNEFIKKCGYLNLDFNGNLGHSIVKNKNHRIYIENGNKKKIGNVKYFTFEPHIALPNSDYGYKKENIYYFNNDKLIEL